MELFLIVLGLIFLLGFIVPIVIKLFFYIKNRMKNDSLVKSDSLFKVDYDINLASYVSKKKGQSNCEINISEKSLLKIMNDSVESFNNETIFSQMPENNIFSFFDMRKL